jgi:Leucine-rich repeat (LRR) protein
MLDADLEVGGTNKQSNLKERQEGRRRERSNTKPLRAKELSGFLLLDHSKVELPEDAIEASLVDLGLTSIKIDDMNYFPNLAYLNLSDNFLRLEDLYCLPGLHDLNLSCNAIQNIYTLKRGFRSLERLNLSYNNLSTHALHMLNELHALKYLDLTGNHLDHLPSDLLYQSPIETLLLTSNNLSTEEDLITLSKIPKIKDLDVGRNQFKSVPDDAVTVKIIHLYHP